MNTYFVTQKSGYDTASLLLLGENFFPTELTLKVREAVFDVREATRCIAYELPTACGFHLFRALEAVIRKYYTHVTGGAAAPKSRNIAVYLEALKKADKGDPKVLGILKQISDLHRNPLIHPEAVFSMEDAAGALGIVRSAMSSMLVGMPNVAETR